LYFDLPKYIAIKYHKKIIEGWTADLDILINDMKKIISSLDDSEKIKFKDEYDYNFGVKSCFYTDFDNIFGEKISEKYANCKTPTDRLNYYHKIIHGKTYIEGDDLGVTLKDIKKLYEYFRLECHFFTREMELLESFEYETQC